eukprot:643514-Rhodomonas_salina.1
MVAKPVSACSGATRRIPQQTHRCEGFTGCSATTSSLNPRRMPSSLASSSSSQTARRPRGFVMMISVSRSFAAPT